MIVSVKMTRAELEVGARCSCDGLVYEAYNATGANIWPPPSVPHYGGLWSE